MRLLAPAKINWTLEVLDRRSDGYHEIRSVMQTVQPCDTLVVAERHRLKVRWDGGAPDDELVSKAARLLAAGEARGADIELTKSIPVAAGLGGGSSDAGAALRALNELWLLGHDQAALTELAAQIGSDVPFFLAGGTAFVAGRGERVTPLPDIAPSWLVLLVPPMRLPEKTKRMYGALVGGDFTDGSWTERLVSRVREGGMVEDGYLYNAFERAAYAAFAGLERYREALLEAGASRVHLAGSGPALFALAPDEAGARAIHERLRVSEARALVVRTLSRAEALSVR